MQLNSDLRKNLPTRATQTIYKANKIDIPKVTICFNRFSLEKHAQALTMFAKLNYQPFCFRGFIFLYNLKLHSRTFLGCLYAPGCHQKIFERFGTQYVAMVTKLLSPYCGAQLVESYCKESYISDTNWLRYLSSSYLIKILVECMRLANLHILKT